MDIVEKKRRTTRKRTRRPTPRPNLLFPKIVNGPEVKTNNEAQVPGFTLPVLANVTYVANGALLSANDTGGMTCLNLLTQGNDYNNRNGNKVTTKSIRLMMAGTATAKGHVRVVIVWDKQPNGTSLTLSDYFNITANFTSLSNPTTFQRFKTIRDHIISIGSDLIFSMDLYAKFQLQTTYTANNGTIADVSSGALYLIAFALPATTVNVSCYETRLRFIDI